MFWQKCASFFSSPYIPLQSAEWLIIGLGNPGEQYTKTRHNVGYRALDILLKESGRTLSPVKGMPVLLAFAEIDNSPCVLARSTEFMNNSGKSVAAVAETLNIAADHIIVIHDELDLPEFKVRLKLGGNENGHNGLKSITAHLGTRDYLRIRMGISRPQKGTNIANYVLSDIPESTELSASINTAARAAELIVTSGLARAQNQIH
ncbi:aminoacyl-tRNA hydrolase [Corynebacterium sp. ES2794-CONJ1]|uniref:aminoacyl-tRNA hydrolase n=1 Tax=unclassified Corynebacterium TaxID=2624378 RepID=UPI00216956FC|nr:MULTISPECIES: aminoacyl-tRNA hydrolase [unclassified Corynebacterium]MCS4489967.1 aminoacyl-tRNA hydrolase [Corynebacterium sp. ES2775-CONJ]MCS4491670.1 aminoacyl-tRNA hydrolase [Corynebacterium sp. ES2715-CONJ3]MCS4531775.1 aminoacyl-tRNA hydrolase [Corynebacterium sp. ES2730-CONJ]MCU9519171.1 aminoacyl-tRNA hydrolase [Corynebacterium sp. ES2794-CONJ1]